MGAKPPRLPLATSLNWGFVPSVAGAGGRGVAIPPGERRPGLGPAVPSAPGAPSPPRPPTGGGLSRSAAVPPRGGRERLRDSSHLTHTVTHSHSHTHRTGARALSRRRHHSAGTGLRPHTLTHGGSGAARGPPPTQQRTRKHAWYPGPRDCAQAHTAAARQGPPRAASARGPRTGRRAGGLHTQRTSPPPAPDTHTLPWGHISSF